MRATAEDVQDSWGYLFHGLVYVMNSSAALLGVSNYRLCVTLSLMCDRYVELCIMCHTSRFGECAALRISSSDSCSKQVHILT